MVQEYRRRPGREIPAVLNMPRNVAEMNRGQGHSPSTRSGLRLHKLNHRSVRGWAAIETAESRLTIRAKRHREAEQLVGRATPLDLKGKRIALQMWAEQNMWHSGHETGFAVVVVKHAEDNRSSELSAILGQRESHTGLAIELAMPNSNPRGIAIRLGCEHSRRHKQDTCRDKHSVLHGYPSFTAALQSPP
jgi:hypothetical protein